MTKYAIDIDGTICNNTWGDYQKAQPNLKRIEYINKLYDSGNIIKMFTARGTTTNVDWYEFTEKQLKEWGVKYHYLHCNEGKPHFDMYICDKSYNCESFFHYRQRELP